MSTIIKINFLSAPMTGEKLSPDVDANAKPQRRIGERWCRIGRMFTWAI